MVSLDSDGMPASSSAIYANHAHGYRAKGYSPLPLPPGSKYPPPAGFTGHGRPMASGADIQSWIEEGHGNGNIALRLPDGVIGLDLDAYDGKPGQETMDEAVARRGPLPPTFTSTSRPGTTSGIRLYRVPKDRAWKNELGPAVEVIQPGHRYLVAAPSTHPEGRPYAWLNADGNECEAPAVDELPELPAAWIAELASGAAADRASKAHVTTAEVAACRAAMPCGDPCPVVLRILDNAAGQLGTGASRHDAALKLSAAMVRAGEQGHYGAGAGLDTLEAMFLASLPGGTSPRAASPGEWSSMVDGAVTFVLADPTPASDKGCCGDLSSAALAAPELTVLAERDLVALPAVATEVEADPELTLATYREKFPRVDLKALLAANRPPREWVISGLIPAGASVALIAPAGAGKSLLLLAACAHIARGEPSFAGMRITQRRVLLLDKENTEDDLAERFKALGVTPDSVDGLDGLVLISLPPLEPLDTPSGGHQLSKILDAYEVGPGDVVVLDSLQRVVGGPENDSDTLRAYYRHTAMMLKQRGVTVIRTDNTGKNTDQGARGTSGKRDDVDVELILTRDANGKQLRIKPGKVRVPGIQSVLLNMELDDDGQLRYTTLGDPFRAAVNATLSQLEDLKVPTETGEGRAKDLLTGAGFKATRDVLRAAIKERKDPLSTPPTVLGGVPSNRDEMDPAESSRRADSGVNLNEH